MAIFREIERRLENFVEGFFNQRFSSAIQPIEVARKLKSEMDRKQQVSVANTYAPNTFMIHLAPEDFEELEGFSQALVGELSEYVKAYAAEKAYRFTGSVQIALAPTPDLGRGECQIHSHFEENSTPVAKGGTQIISARELEEALAAAGKARLLNESSRVEYTLANDATTIGRKSDNDVIVDDVGASRHHARIEVANGDFYLVDLESTNGTVLNGDEISRVLLVDGDRIVIGRIELTFRQEPGD